MTKPLLTLEESAQEFGLASAEGFSRFARTYRIPLIRFGRKIVRVRREDLERAIDAHAEPRPDVSE